METLTFQIEYDDGSTRNVEIPMSFDDVPDQVAVGLLGLGEHERVAHLLAWRLDVSLEASQRLVDELLAGEGVVVA